MNGLLSKIKKYKNAEFHLQKAIELEPKTARYYHGYAIFLRDQYYLKCLEFANIMRLRFILKKNWR